jgi:hypothetical protein
MNYLRDDIVLSDILCLVGVEVTPEVIATWSDDDCEEIEHWASSTYLRASDNYGVKIPPEPKFLQQYKKVYHGKSD